VSTPPLIPKDHPWPGLHGVNTRILVEGEPIRPALMFLRDQVAGAWPHGSAVGSPTSLNIARHPEGGGSLGGGGGRTGEGSIFAWRVARWRPLPSPGRSSHHRHATYLRS